MHGGKKYFHKSTSVKILIQVNSHAFIFSPIKSTEIYTQHIKIKRPHLQNCIFNDRDALMYSCIHLFDAKAENTTV